MGKTKSRNHLWFPPSTTSYHAYGSYLPVHLVYVVGAICNLQQSQSLDTQGDQLLKVQFRNFQIWLSYRIQIITKNDKTLYLPTNVNCWLYLSIKHVCKHYKDKQIQTFYWYPVESSFVIFTNLVLFSIFR